MASAIYSVLLQGFSHRNETEAEHFLRETSIQNQNWLGCDKDVSIWHAYNHNSSYFTPLLHLVHVVLIYSMLKYCLHIKVLDKKNEEVYFIFLISSVLLLFVSYLDSVRYLFSIVIFLCCYRIYEIQKLFKDIPDERKDSSGKLSLSDENFIASLSYY